MIGVSWVSLFKMRFFQKVFGINRKVKWPVHFTSKIKCPEKIIYGNRPPGMTPGCYIDGRNGIVFGDNVWIAPRVSIVSMNHDLNDYTKYRKARPIRIDRDCWIGTGAVILPGVHLGPHTIVAAGAVVSRSFPKGNQMLAGNPAERIWTLNEYGQ